MMKTAAKALVIRKNLLASVLTVQTSRNAMARLKAKRHTAKNQAISLVVKSLVATENAKPPNRAPTFNLKSPAAQLGFFVFIAPRLY